jgi:endonuclease/exonuclease/phosphatase family metal-dependent hydrolase
LSLLIRTWNVFHGMSSPPDRRSYLERMLRLATEDEPDVLCLQEVPSWALGRLAGWSGMQSFGAVAKRAPLPGELGGRMTELHQARFRSVFVGQANAILLRPGLRALATGSIVLNPTAFRRRLARELGLDVRRRLRWAKERRVCHAVRTDALTVANLHGSAVHDWRLPDAELLRAATFADDFAEPDDVLVLAGDFNVQDPLLAAYAGAVDGIDHVLVRGAAATAVVAWSLEQRRQNRVVLSDHPVVEARIEVGA